MILASSTKHKRKRRRPRKPERKWEQNNNKNPKRKENKQKERVIDERNSTEQHDLLRTEWSLESSLLRIKTPLKWTFWGFQAETPIRTLLWKTNIWFVTTEISKSSLSPSKAPILEMRKSLQTCRAPIWNYHQVGTAEIFESTWGIQFMLIPAYSDYAGCQKCWCSGHSNFGILLKNT